MRLPIPIRRLVPTLLLLALPVVVLTAAEPPVIADSGVPVAAAETLLPSGAIAHARVADLGATLNALDALVMQFVPKKAVPPDLAPLLALPHPVLAYVGQQTIGLPLDADALAKIAGVAAGRPLTLTLYPGNGWIAAVPVADHRAFTGLLINLTRPRAFAAVDVAGRKGWQVEGTNPDLPLRMTVLASKEAVYLCSAPELAAHLAVAGEGHLADDALFAGFATDKRDVVIGVSTAPVLPLLAPVIGQLSHLSPEAFAGMRRNLRRSLGPDNAQVVDFNLRFYTGFDDLDQVLDYAEALVGAAGATVVPAWGGALQGVEGGVLALEISPEALRATVTVHAAGIDGLAAKPLPLAELATALGTLPGPRQWFSAVGQDRPAGQGRLAADWLDQAVVRLKAKGLTSPFLAGAARYLREREDLPELTAVAPWVLTTSCQELPTPPQADDVLAWWSAVTRSAPVQPELLVFPALPGDTLAKHFAARAAAANRNEARWTTVLTGSLGDDRWYDSSARFRVEGRAGKADKLISEDVLTTRSGLFGYSQHELINRTTAYAAVRGKLHLLQQVAGDAPSWLDAPPAAARPLPTAMAALLQRIPAGADAVAAARVLPVLADAVTWLDSGEQAWRRGLDRFLAQAQTALDAGGEPRTALRGLRLPLLVDALCRGRDGKLYLVFTGNTRYPRPAAVPVLRPLLAGYLDHRDENGGMVAWRRAEPGRLTFGVSQDPRALALLVRSAVDAWYTRFMVDGDPEPRLRAALGAAHDGEPPQPQDILLINPARRR